MQRPLIIAAVLASGLFVPPDADAAALITQSFASDTTVAGGDNFLERATATWTVNSGVIVDVTQGIFIESNGLPDSPNGVDAVFTITGGGTVNANRGDNFAFRLGHFNGNGPGTLVIDGGSTFSVTGAGAGFGEDGDGGGVVLSGLGSTFRGAGAFNASTQLFTATNTNGGQFAPISFSRTNGATRYDITSSGGFTTVTAASFLIGDQAFSADTTLAGGDRFLEREAVTWTVDEGVTVDIDNGLFIESNTLPDVAQGGADAVLTITGGGTVNANRGDNFAFRLGHLDNNGPGTLVIEDGSTFNVTGAGAGFGEDGDGGGIVLSGIGSSFRGAGTFDVGTELFTATNTNSGRFTAISFSLAGGATGYEVTSAGGFTTVTAIPEPGSLALLGLGVLMVARRRR